MGKQSEELVKRVEFEGVEFTVVNWKGEWCYIDKELSEYLEYGKVNDMTRYINDKYLFKVKAKEWSEFKMNNAQCTLFDISRKGAYLVNELGIYECILKAKPKSEYRKQIVSEFKDWVFNTLKSIRQDYGYNAWEIINMMSIDDSKILKSQYIDICEDINRKPNVPHMYVDILKLVAYYYGYEYEKGIDIKELRDTKYPNILQDRKRIGDLYLRYFAMTESHKDAFSKTKLKLMKEKNTYLEIAK